MDVIETRKQAVQLFYQGYTKTEICRQLNRSRPWLDRWLNRYDPDDVTGSLKDQRTGQKGQPRSWSQEIKAQVLEMRRSRMDREKNPFNLIGAAAIHFELSSLGSVEVPPIRTIHYWLNEAGLIRPKKEKNKDKESLPFPQPEAKQPNQVQQLDLKGPIYLKGSSQKYYLIVLRDRFTRRCALDVVKSKEAQGIANHLVLAWQSGMGLPEKLQMDNALEFRGSNKYPRSFGKVVRLALDLGVEPIFNPVSEPWRNGCVERFNQFLGDRLLAISFDSEEQLFQAVKECESFCNQHHRLECLDGLTPIEAIKDHPLTFIPTDYNRHLNNTLKQEHGWVSFIRLVRRSGRITLGAKDRFMVDPDRAYSYVVAQVNLADQTVTISQNEKPIVTYDYSKSTIGAWAGPQDTSTEN